ncbi:methylated-DNA--[protein]-cysteine S-methyltransferase [bacterium]|nr:methylated-DNA--[protein]-cysteine S-methyltransferase [bacterium]
MKHYSRRMDSPVGKLTLIANDHSLVALLWENDDPKRFRVPPVESSEEHLVLDRAEAQLNEYFQGRRTLFDVPYEFYGTDFQKEVWEALSRIPYGKKRTYLDIAKAVQSPKACRAVGAANGKNPLSIIIPCHRVVGADGKLTGFAGGLKAKKFLLDLESRQRH